MLAFLAATALAAVAPAPTPALTPQQSAALRCGVVFARGARMQTDRRPDSAAWPPLETRGREFFVRVMARLMDDTGAGRGQLSALADRESRALTDDATVAAAMPACLGLLDAAGI